MPTPFAPARILTPPRARLWTLAALVLASVILAAAPRPALACAEITQQAQTAYQGGDIGTLEQLYAAAEANPGCSTDTVAWIGKAITGSVLRQIQADVQAGGTLAAHEQTLRGAQQYGQDWRVEAWLGDIAFERGAFTEAASSYQAALNTLNDEAATPKAPPVEVIQKIYAQAEMARLAADDYVPAPTTRAGEPGGLSAPSFRGFVPTARQYPMEFQFGSTLLTAKGLRALRDLRDSLRATGARNVTLIGHTDPVGDMAANDRLSMSRARAVGIALRQEGFTGEITIIGRGERDPLPYIAPMTQGQYHQALRRVEVRR